jgi:glycosyltransferase involved in cell wall biosynthesis
MSIYVDVSSAVHSKAGIGRYAGELARALVPEYPDRLKLFYNGVGAQPPAGLEALPARTVAAGYKPWRMAVWLGQALRVGFDRLVPGAELFHATEHLLPPFHRVPTVLTVHDMIFKRFPEHQKRLNYWYLNATMPLYCRRADAIITVSHHSKHDLISDYGIDPEKVFVIYEAASGELAPAAEALESEARARYGLPQRYLIFVGTIEPRKNLVRVVEALQLLLDRGLSIPLLVVGRKGWLYDEFFRRLDELEVRHAVHFSGYVPAQDLPVLYSAATLAIMPSVYEGFGLPILEAMACGTPVVSSRASCLPEIGGEAARYFDPHSVEEMAQVIQAVWNDAELRAEMSEQGREWAAGFSWWRAAQETAAVYERLLA